MEEKTIDLLCNVRELATLVDIRNYITTEKDKISYNGVTEYDYCKIEGRLATLTELESLINEKIKLLTNKSL